MKPLTKTETAVYRSYHLPNTGLCQRRKTDTVVYGYGTIKHELSKALGALMIGRWGDVKWSPELVYHMNLVGETVDELFKDFPKEKGRFITEVTPNSEKKRRVDLVSLTNSFRYEFETSKKIDKSVGRKDTVSIPI